MDGQDKPRRSDRTRAAILQAAKDRFAADGYERATIRAIAADAGVDPAMVMRYFGNKERLFAAAAEIDLRMPDLTAVPRNDVGKVLVNHLLDRWEGDEKLVALLRAAVSNDTALERVRQIFSTQLLPMIAALHPGVEDVSARVGLMASQTLGLALTRYVLRLPPVVALDRDTIVDWIGPTMQRYLTG